MMIDENQHDDENDEFDEEEMEQQENALFAKAQGGQDWHREDWVNKLVEKMLNYTSDFVVNATPEEETETWIRGPKAYWMAFQFNK